MITFAGAMKKLKNIVNWTIWSLLALYVFFVILIQLPFMQRWMGQIVAGALGEKLGTTVSVGRVDVGLFNRLIIDDVVIKDQLQQDMLSARRMSVKVELLPLLSGRVSISSAQLFGAQAVFYCDSAGAVPNYQFALDALSDKEKKEPSRLDLHIGSLIVRQLSMKYDQKDAPETPGRLNMKHLNVSDVSAHILLRTLTNDSINASIKRITLHEQSGLELNRLSLKLEANHHHALLTGFALEMPNTTLSIDSIQTSYSLDSLLNTIYYCVPCLEGKIAFDDLAPVLPENFPSGYDMSLDASFFGTAHSINCRQLNMALSEDAMQLSASGYADSWERSFQTNVKHFSVSSDLLTQLQELFPDMPPLVGRIGSIDITADAGTDDYGDIHAQGRAITSSGTLSWHGTMTEDAKKWTAHIDTDSLDIGRLTANNELGLLAANLDVSAIQQQISIIGSVPRIDLKGHSYHNLSVDAVYTPSAVSGKLKVDDMSLQADMEGIYERTSPNNPHLQLTGIITQLAPQAMHLSDRWGAATFSAIVNADISGSSIDNAEGTIDLKDFTMALNDTTQYYLNNLYVQMGNNGQRFLHLSSDFGEVQFTGHSNGTFYLQPFGQIIGKSSVADNDFTLKASITDSRWMQTLLDLPLDLYGPLEVEAHVNDAEGRMQIEGTIPAFIYSNVKYNNGRVTLTREGDNTACNVSVTRFTNKGTPFYLTISSQANMEEVNSALSLTNSENDGGTVNMKTRLYVNDNGKREIHTSVMPALLMYNNNIWKLNPCDIVYSDKRLMVDNFKLYHDDEYFIVDGIASVNPEDTLKIDMKEIDIATVLETVGFRSVRFGGHAAGLVYICQAFSKPEVWAELDIEDFLFQDASMGNLTSFAIWNGEDRQIDFEAAIDGIDGAETLVDGYISLQRKELDLGIRAQGTNIGFVHSFTRSFIGHIEGQAFGNVRLYGPLKQLDILGDVAVNGKASIKPLGTTYTFSNDTVHLTPGTIGFSQFTVNDRDGHQALLNGDITHTHFKNIHFDLHADAEQLLAYNFPKMDAGSTIGGTVWASGQAEMHGRPGEVAIDCDVTPTPGSFFIYNASSPDAINRQQFITWGNPNPDTSLTDGSSSSSVQQGNSGGGGSDLRLNLRINATPDATLRLLMDQNSGDYITLNGSGVLRASYYNKEPFQMFGTYAIERGTYSMTIQNLLKKNFQFQPGSTMLFGGDPYSATLNWKAVHTVNGVSLSDLGLGNSFTSNSVRVNCLMNIVGTAGEPRVEFDLELPTLNSEEQQMIRSIMATEQELNQQVVYLLGIGRFYPQGANNANTQGYGQTELAMQSILSGTVSSQINQLLSQVIKNDDWNFGANISTGNEGWHNAEYEGVVSGRMLNNRLLLNGQFGYRDNATQANPSFIGDFDIQYLLTPGGSLALKAYNQTNDRYFTHSALNTQGVGIIMKKDFNGLRDLFTHRKKRGEK